MRTLMFNFALLMLAPSFIGKSLLNESKPSPGRSLGRSIASLTEIQKELEDTIKEKLKKKIADRDLAKKEVELNEKDDNCKDELKISKEKLAKLEADVKELENLKIPQSNQDLVDCLVKSKPDVLSTAISNLIAQQEYTLRMYTQMQNLLLGYQIQNMYFEISKPTYSDLGQQTLSLNSILSLNAYTPWIQPQQPLPQVEVQSYNFSNESDLAAEAYNRMIPDVSRNPNYSPNWGGFTLEQGRMPEAQSFNFGSAALTDVSQNQMYIPSMTGFGEESPVSSYNFN